MKSIIISPARFGKDTAAEFLRDNFQISYRGSSELCSEIFIFDALKYKYGYQTPKECFEDRVNHRSEWFNLISEYNLEDPTRLCSKIFESRDVYCGMRRFEELEACKAKWPELLVIYIDRSKVLPDEDKSSCTITKDQADIIIDNNGTLEQFHNKLFRLGCALEN